MKRDVDTILDPAWRAQYSVLLRQYTLLEKRLKEALDELTEVRRENDELYAARHIWAERFERQMELEARVSELEALLKHMGIRVSILPGPALRKKPRNRKVDKRGTVFS